MGHSWRQPSRSVRAPCASCDVPGRVIAMKVTPRPIMFAAVGIGTRIGATDTIGSGGLAVGLPRPATAPTRRAILLLYMTNLPNAGVRASQSWALATRIPVLDPPTRLLSLRG